MNQTKKSAAHALLNITDVMVAFILGAVSFWHFSPLFYISYNSDHAIHVLISADFNFLRDFFFWGQNRLGSFVPMIASLFVKLGVEPIIAASLVKWFCLFGSFLISRQWIHSFWGRTLVAVLLFFPHENFFETVFLGHPYAEQLLMILFSFWIATIIQSTDSIQRKRFLFTLYFFVNIVAIWISFSSVMVVPITAFFLLQKFTKLSTPKSLLILMVKVLLISGAYYALGRILQDAYHDSSGFSRYGIAGPSGFLSGIGLLVGYMWEAISFKTSNTSIASTYLFVILWAVLIRGWWLAFNKGELTRYKMPIYFLLLAMASLLPSLISEWVLKWGIPFRYFSPAYFLFFFSVILFVERMKQKLWVGLIVGGFAFVAIQSSLVKTYYGFQNNSRVRSEVKNLEKGGLIGSFWFTYVLASMSPETIDCVPHDKEFIRNQHGIQEFLKHDLVYVVKNKFLEEFPDTLSQFGSHYLRQEKPDFNISNAVLHEYRKVGEASSE